MADVIRVKRGQLANIPALSQGEFGFALDEERVYIGGVNGNIGLGKKSDFDDFNTYVKTPTNFTNKLMAMQYPANTVKIVVAGDSIVYGDLGAGRAATPFPAKLQEHLQTFYGNSNISVINAGVNGIQSDNALAIFDTDVLAFDPDVVLIMYGINDISGAVTPSNTIDAYKNNIAAMIEKCIDAGVAVIVLPPTPTNNNTYGVANKYIYQYGRAAIEVAKKYGVRYFDINQKINDLYTAGVYNSFDMQGVDYVHFTQSGYDMVAYIVFKYCFCDIENITRIDSNKVSSFCAVNTPYVKSNLSGIYTNAAQANKQNVLAYKDGHTGTYVSFEFFNEVKGMDLFLLHPSSPAGGLLTVYDNGVAITTVDFYSIESVLYDVKHLLLENVGLGYHKIELNVSNLVQGQTAESTYVFYASAFQFEPTRVGLKNGIYSNNTSYGKLDVMQSFINGRVKYSGQIGAYTEAVLFDSPCVQQKTGKTLVMEFEGKLYNKSGLLFFANKAGNSNNKGANFGYILTFNPTNCQLFAPSNVNNEVAVIGTGAVTLNYDIEHTIKITITDSGLITVYVDGISLIAVTNNVVKSGYVGFYSQALTAVDTMYADRFEYSYI